MTEKAIAQLEKLRKSKDAPSDEAAAAADEFLRGLELRATEGGIEAYGQAGEWSVRFSFLPDGRVVVLYSATAIPPPADLPHAVSAGHAVSEDHAVSDGHAVVEDEEESS